MTTYVYDTELQLMHIWPIMVTYPCGCPCQLSIQIWSEYIKWKLLDQAMFLIRDIWISEVYRKLRTKKSGQVVSGHFEIRSKLQKIPGRVLRTTLVLSRILPKQFWIAVLAKSVMGPLMELDTSSCSETLENSVSNLFDEKASHCCWL